MGNEQLKVYKAWDLPVRLFHWINFFAVVNLLFVGLIMMYKTELGISGNEAKIALKQLHALIGYVFVVNLGWRIIWGFIGNKYARWRELAPSKSAIYSYRESIHEGAPQQFIGHNPLGKLAVIVILLTLTVLAVSGLIRAGTDVYYPPFGGLVSGYVAAENVDPATLIPYNSTGIDPQKAATLKTFKRPIGKIHVYAAYFLMFLILLHITAVVLEERREGGSIISAMFSGRKILSRKPADLD